VKAQKIRLKYRFGKLRKKDNDDSIDDEKVFKLPSKVPIEAESDEDNTPLSMRKEDKLKSKKVKCNVDDGFSKFLSSYKRCVEKPGAGPGLSMKRRKDTIAPDEEMHTASIPNDKMCPASIPIEEMCPTSIPTEEMCPASISRVLATSVVC
jgi:hypothetical protein